MGVHTATRQFTKRVFRYGMTIRATRDSLEIAFGTTAKAWPLIWKRATLAGLKTTILAKKKPKLLIQSELDSFLELIEPRALRLKRKWSKLMPLLAGSSVIVLALAVPLSQPPPRVQKPDPKAGSCSLTRLKQVVSGDLEAPEIQFSSAQAFGGITSGVMTCKGARYRYTLESKGLERVLKVGKLDS